MGLSIFPPISRPACLPVKQYSSYAIYRLHYSDVNIVNLRGRQLGVVANAFICFLVSLACWSQAQQQNMLVVIITVVRDI